MKAETTVSAVKAKTKPKYELGAVGLLERCRAFYENEENEKAFRAWKEAQKKTR